ncbi:hypothetical protein ANCDUO_03970 [Ancylostoma duodenale]|uniref:Uncharacterized protein n=1 Tax=Ancylostoma duodenale TaxID=51022 RepID=A0A0C2DSF7_9BILA|nr:hypothetical protein ANCDUO_03970 [Ancylostoma duodenale]
MVCELDEELSDLMRMVVEKKELIEEKTATHKECRDIELSYRRPLDPLERTQSDSVMQKFEDFTIRLHEAKKLIAETKKISKDIKTMTKKVELLRIDGGASDDTLSSSFLNAPNLETSLYQKSSLKPSGSFFSSANPITPPSVNSQEATSKLGTEHFPLRKPPQRPQMDRSHCLRKATTATPEKSEEKKSSLFGGIGATASVVSEKKDEKQITFGNKAATESSTTERAETKPTSLFGGGAKQSATTSIFGGATLSKPLSFPSAPLAKPSETVTEKDQKEPSLASSPLTATTTATTTTPSSIFGKSTIVSPTTATTTTSSLFGTSSISSTTPATTTTATTSLFGTTSLSSTTPATTATTTTSSLFGTTSIISTAPTTTTTTTTSSSIFGSLKSTTAQPSAFGSLFGAKDTGSTQGSAAGANAVTFSFKPKTEAEAAQPTASFTFTPKPSSGGSLGQNPFHFNHFSFLFYY